MYQDNMTLQMDSVFVTNSVISFDTIYDNNNSYIGTYEFFRVNSADTSGNSWVQEIPATTENYFGLFKVYKSHFNNGVYQGRALIAYYPFMDTLIAFGQADIQLYDTLPSLMVAGNTYSHVVAFRNSNDLTEGGQPVIRYFAPEVGLIRIAYPLSGNTRDVLYTED